MGGRDRSDLLNNLSTKKLSTVSPNSSTYSSQLKNPPKRRGLKLTVTGAVLVENSLALKI